jgi:outer membrane murein-binding lipoprotein Lpp
MLMLHEDRLRRTDLAIMAYQQSVNVSAAAARRATFNSRFAWSTAGGLAVILFVGITWATHHLTRAEAQVDQLNTQVRQLSDTAATKTRELDTLRADAESARVAAARAEGELSAAKSQMQSLAEQSKHVEVSQSRISAAPTTQPFSFIQTLAPLIQ